MLLLYITPSGSLGWQAAAEATAVAAGRPTDWTKRHLCKWARAFILNRDDLPYHGYGCTKPSALDNHFFASRLTDHLASAGTFASAKDVVDLTKAPDIQLVTGRVRPASLPTARLWMNRLGFGWGCGPKGQYKDGHERKDVVAYRKEVFLPKIAELIPKMRHYNDNGDEIPTGWMGPYVVLWVQDESFYYANDQRTLRWVPPGEKAVPHPKGQGTSIMVSGFVCQEYGWLIETDGSPSDRARVFFKAGEGREGYYSRENQVNQAEIAMNVVSAKYPTNEHVFMYDNANTHTARAPGALSALNLTAKPSEKCDTAPLLDTRGKPVRDQQRKVTRVRTKLRDTKNPLTGEHQSLYFPNNHDQYPGFFIGMRELLLSRGIDVDKLGLRVQCPPPSG